MQPTRSAEPGTERQQLAEKLWTISQRVVVLLVAMCAGLFIGYQWWGEARTLRETVAQLEERIGLREKERDTLKSQMAIIDRDKKELEKRYQDLQAQCAPSAGGKAAAAAAEGQ